MGFLQMMTPGRYTDRVRTIATQGVALLMACTAPCLAQKPVPRGAAIVGDVFLVMKSGDAKPVSGRAVYLILDSSEARASFKTRCEMIDYEKRMGGSSAGLREAARGMEHTASVYATATASTGLEGKYVFRNVAPGKYWLLVHAPIYDATYAVWGTVTIAGRDTIRADLTNEGVALGEALCAAGFQVR